LFTAATTASITVQAGVATHIAFGQSPTGNSRRHRHHPGGHGRCGRCEWQTSLRPIHPTLWMVIATGPMGAVLGGTTTVAAVGGVATFSNLTLSTAGVYTTCRRWQLRAGHVRVHSPSARRRRTGLRLHSNRSAPPQRPVLAPVKVNVQNSGGTLLSGDMSNVTIANCQWSRWRNAGWNSHGRRRSGSCYF